MLAVAAVLGEFCCFCSCSSSLVLRPTATRAFSLCTVSSLQLLQLCSLQFQTSLSLQLLAYSFSAILLECCGFFQPYSSSVAVFLRSLNRVLRFFCLTPQVLRFFLALLLKCCGFFFGLTPQVLRFFFPTPQVLRFFLPYSSSVAVFFSLLLKCCGFFSLLLKCCGFFFALLPKCCSFFQSALLLKCCSFPQVLHLILPQF